MSLLTTATAWAEVFDRFTVNNLKYMVTSESPKEVTLLGFESDGAMQTNLTIPVSVTNGSNTYDVTCITNDAFKWCYELATVTFAADSKVGVIEQYAFEGCTSLTTINIPASVTDIRSNPFSNCTKLTSITVAEGNANYKSVNDVLYNIGETQIIAYPIGKNDTSYEIPASVEYILTDAFSHCQYLTTVTFAENSKLVAIRGNAFYYSSKLSSVGSIPASVKEIGEQAFFECKLSSITLNSNPKIGPRAFNKDNTTTYAVTMNLDVTNNKVGSDYWMTFYNKNDDSWNFQADNNTTVYAGMVDNDCTKLQLIPVNNRIVKHGEAVILKSTASPIVMTLTKTNSDGDYNYNSLKGGQLSQNGYDVYTLAANGGVVGFYKFTGDRLDSQKAHLEIPPTGLGARGFIGFDEGETTSVNEELRMKDEESAAAEWFTLDGRRLNGQPTTKGLYISNGRKVVIK